MNLNHVRVIPSETQQHTYNLKSVQRRVTTELLIDAGIPLVGTLLTILVKGVCLGFPENIISW